MELNDIELKTRLVDLLYKFHVICLQNKLRYSLAYGTLLGAVRHKGFIPWDDDIDVLMPQDDYIKFLNLPEFHNQDLDSDCVLYEINNDSTVHISYLYPFAKLVDGKTYIISDFFREVGGIWIDIFPVTGLPTSQQDVKQHFSEMGKLHLQLSAAHRYRKLRQCGPVTFLKQIRCNYYHCIHKKLVYKMKKKAFDIPYENSREVAVSIWNYGLKEKMPKEYFDELIKLEFEGKEFYGLKHYDDYLTRLYGDWRKLPPKEQRVAHHYYRAFMKGM